MTAHGALVVAGFAVAAGLGAVIRVAVSGRGNRPGGLPLGTLAVNVAGALALGLLAGSSSQVLTIVGTGGIGALTTWSAFTVETDVLARRSPALAAGYLTFTLAAGVGAAYLGLVLAG